MVPASAAVNAGLRSWSFGAHPAASAIASATRPPRIAMCALIGGQPSGGDLLGDDLPHDLGGAAADREEPHVAKEALDGVLAHVAVAAVELHAVIGDSLRHLGGEELHH